MPPLRFPEFRNTEGWAEIELKAIANLINARAGENIHTLMSVTSGVGLVSQKEKFGREIAGDSYKNYIVIKKWDFAYNKSSTKLYPEGYIAMLKDIETAAVPNSIFTCFSIDKDKVFPQFLDHWFHNNFHGKWLRKFIEVGARAHGSLSIENDLLLGMPFFLSSIKEQQKIAACLTSLDALITAQSEKVAHLKVHKKGLMQQLFPADGETVPQLRFAEFRDTEGWEEKPIGEKVDLLSGIPFTSSEISEDSNGIPILRGINITEGFIRHSKDIDRFFLGNSQNLSKYRLKIDDLVIGMDGSKVGKNSALITNEDSGALLIQRVARLRTKHKATIQFIFQQINSTKFHSYVDKVNTSGGIPHISASQINSFKIYFPSVEEQQKISACLTSIDDLISAESDKLGVLKGHKKGLMQQLFPNTEEVGG